MLKQNNRLYNIINEVSQSDSKLDEFTKLNEVLTLDSLKKLELVSKLEKIYETEIHEGSILPSMTISDLRGVIKSRKSVESGIRIRESNFHWPVKSVRLLMQLTILPIMGLFIKVKAEGIENLPNPNSPVIFAINHTSHMDTPVFVHSMPMKFKRRLAIAAAADVFYPEAKADTFKLKFFRRFMEISLNIFPFSRKMNLRQSIKNCMDVLSLNHHVCIYPESTRSPDGKLLPFKNGIGILVHGSGSPVVPVRIKGIYPILPKGRKFPKPGTVTISFGKPYIAKEDDSYIKITSEIRNLVQAL